MKTNLHHFPGSPALLGFAAAQAAGRGGLCTPNVNDPHLLTGETALRRAAVWRAPATTHNWYRPLFAASPRGPAVRSGGDP